MKQSVLPVILNTSLPNDASPEKESANLKKLSYHEGLLQCSHILLSPERKETALREALRIIVATGNIDTAFIYRNVTDANNLRYMSRVEHVRAKNDSSEDQATNTWTKIAYTQGFTKVETALSNREHIITTPDDLEGEARNTLKAQRVESSLLMPIFLKERWWGFIGFDYLTQEGHSWSKRHISLIHTAAELIAAFLLNNEITEELKASQAMLNRVINQIPTRVYWKDSELRFLGCNKQFAKDHGFDYPEQLVGQKREEIPSFKHENNGSISDHFVLNNKVPYHQQEAEKTLHNKQKIWTNINKSPLVDEKENVLGVLGTYEDVTQIKEANLQLTKSNQSTLNLLNSLNSGILLIDQEHANMFYNQKFLELWQMPEDIVSDVEKRRAYILDSLIAPEELGQIDFNKDESFDDIIVSIHELKDGRFFERSVAPFRPQGKSIGQVISYRDISERKQNEKLLVEAKEEADHANRAKSEFLAMMSHELRTPMNAIIGFTELLYESISTTEDKEYLYFIGKNGEHLLQLIDQILDLAKIEAGSLEIQHEPIYPWKLASNVMRSMIPRTIGKDIKLTYALSEAIPMCLWSDEIRFRQMLFNLIGNAVKFTDRGSIELIIDSVKDESGEWIRCLIHDTGIGIAKTTQKKLFSPFCQGDSSTTRRYGGTGLGLTISQKLAEQMGGKIWATPREQGGSTFGFQIPLKTCTEKHRIESLKSDKLSKKQAILIIGECPIECQLFKAIFQKWGLNYHCVSIPEEALEQLTQNWHILFVSIKLIQDKESPLSLAVKKLNQETQTAIIGLSDDRYTQAMVNECEIDFNAIKRTPLDIDELFSTLTQLLTPQGPDSEGPTFLPPTQHSESSRALKILVVEDNEDNQKLTLTFLTKLGHQHTLATNGDHALQILENNDFDLILMDIQMAGIDGLETTQRIRAGHPRAELADIPIIALTASAMRGDRERCLDAGMNAYLSKPVRLADLSNTIKQFGQ